MFKRAGSAVQGMGEYDKNSLLQRTVGNDSSTVCLCIRNAFLCLQKGPDNNRGRQKRLSGKCTSSLFRECSTLHHVREMKSKSSFIVFYDTISFLQRRSPLASPRTFRIMCRGAEFPNHMRHSFYRGRQS